jgi:hypothetical protein
LEGFNRSLQLAIELRNDLPGSNVRVGYQPVVASVPQGWNYSSYFDVTTGGDAFSPTWATAWAQTRWYLEGYTSAGRLGVSFVDNAFVEQLLVPEPSVIGLLILGGGLSLWRRRAAI